MRALPPEIATLADQPASAPTLTMANFLHTYVLDAICEETQTLRGGKYVLHTQEVPSDIQKNYDLSGIMVFADTKARKPKPMEVPKLAACLRVTLDKLGIEGDVVETDKGVLLPNATLNAIAEWNRKVLEKAELVDVGPDTLGKSDDVVQTNKGVLLKNATIGKDGAVHFDHQTLVKEPEKNAESALDAPVGRAPLQFATLFDKAAKAQVRNR